RGPASCRRSLCRASRANPAKAAARRGARRGRRSPCRELRTPALSAPGGTLSELRRAALALHVPREGQAEVRELGQERPAVTWAADEVGDRRGQLGEDQRQLDVRHVLL